MRFSRFASRALVSLALIASTLLAPVIAVDAPNLVENPSLEAGTNWPECYSPSGWGTEATWTSTLGHSGDRAVTVSILSYQSGDRKLLQSELPGCAPDVTAGVSYELAVWYQSTSAANMTVFRHSDTGWSYWGDLSVVSASIDWAKAEATTPPIPVGTDMIVFGLSLAASGTLTTDDYSLTARGTPDEPEPGGNLVVNPHLATGDVMPSCFTTAGWGERIVSATISDEVPPGSPTGTRSFAIDMSERTSGDVKLLLSDAAGCAPAVTAGEEYEASIDYMSTSSAISLTLFQHSVTGWSYWTDVLALPATDGWSTARSRLPAIPDGIDRISFGLSIAADGSLTTSNYSLSMVTETGPVDPEPGDPAADGSWTVLDSEFPIRAMHTTLLYDGRLLLVAGSGNDGVQFAAGTFRAAVWDPADNSFLEVPTPYDMFCAGHVTLPDGKVLLAGGTEAFPAQNQGPNTFRGSQKSYYFDPTDNQFHATTDMAGGHWYPSLTKLADGDLWAAGGLDEKAEGTVLTEHFDYSSMSWLAPDQVPQTWSFWGTYPHMYLLDDGMLFYAGAHTFGNGLPGTGASLYNWETAQIWDVPGLRQKDMRDQAGSVLLPPAQDQRVMIVGGGNTDTNLPGINLVDIIDLSTPTPSYQPGPDLPGAGKGYVNTLNLPNRTVLAVNGAQYNRAGNVFTAAIYDPVSNAWASVAADPVGRNYHSSAILLPDGRVAVFGSNPADNSWDFRISLYSPPYLFAGARPSIVSAPPAASYGDVIDVVADGEIVSAALMSPLSATHQTDTNARLVDLPIAGADGSYTAQVPNNANLLPPGPYMLTVLDSAGVPSVAKWMWIS